MGFKKSLISIMEKIIRGMIFEKDSPIGRVNSFLMFMIFAFTVVVGIGSVISDIIKAITTSGGGLDTLLICFITIVLFAGLCFVLTYRSEMEIARMKMVLNKRMVASDEEAVEMRYIPHDNNQQINEISETRIEMIRRERRKRR